MVHKTRSIRRGKLWSSNSSWYLLTKIFWELAWKKKVSHLPISSLYTFFLGYRSYCVLRIPKPSLRGNLKLFFWELLLKSYVLLKNVLCFLHKSLLVPLHAVNGDHWFYNFLSTGSKVEGNWSSRFLTKLLTYLRK